MVKGGRCEVRWLVVYLAEGRCEMGEDVSWNRDVRSSRVSIGDGKLDDSEWGLKESNDVSENC